VKLFSIMTEYCSLPRVVILTKLSVLFFNFFNYSWQ